MDLVVFFDSGFDGTLARGVAFDDVHAGGVGHRVLNHRRARNENTVCAALLQDSGGRKHIRAQNVFRVVNLRFDCD